MSAVERVCELEGWTHRHYCDNAAQCEVVINEAAFRACWECLHVLAEDSVLHVAA